MVRKRSIPRYEAQREQSCIGSADQGKVEERAIVWIDEKYKVIDLIQISTLHSQFIVEDSSLTLPGHYQFGVDGV